MDSPQKEQSNYEIRKRLEIKTLHIIGLLQDNYLLGFHQLVKAQ